MRRVVIVIIALLLVCLIETTAVWIGWNWCFGHVWPELQHLTMGDSFFVALGTTCISTPIFCGRRLGKKNDD